MYCANCGSEINDNSQFCSKCGVQLNNLSTNSFQGNINKDKKHKSKTKMALFFILGFLISSIIFIILVFLHPFNESASNEVINKGFSSKEQAIYSYLDYLKKRDIDGMISCFAVEEYCENADFKYYSERIGAYSPISSNILPVFGDYSYKLYIKRRVDSIIDTIYYQYLVLSDTDINNGAMIKISDYGSVDDMINNLYPLKNVDDLISGLKYEKDYYLSMDDLNSDGKLDKLYANNKSYYHYDDYDIIYIKFSFNNEIYVLCADVVKYDNKWYILGFTNTASNIIGCPFTSAGLVKEDYFSESISKYR